MKKSLLFVAGLILAISFIRCDQTQEIKYSGNPLFDEPFTADPTAIVYNDTLWLFTGSDEQEEGVDGFLMRRWYVFSTADMVNWTNHGAVLSVDDFEWGSHNAFAADVVENHGKFWWYVPIVHADPAARVHEGFAMGVAVADHPAGPYHDPIGKPLIADTTANSIVLNIDPDVFVDDDGRVYMYWGSWDEVRVVELKSNMVELAGPVMNVEGLDNFFEAPFMHKRGDIYYMSYAAGYPSRTEYAISDNPLGPWVEKGVINDVIPNSPTNHQAIVHFKGNDYFIYHTAGLPNGGPFRRSVCIDKLEYDENGLIKKVVRTTTGVPQIK
ncbi:glycoside hydrolase family 43 protein [Alkalitalea saponilacus]|uniref:Glycosyl hydrolases family 43 n=1 Tax=Alkalitalea saponilacus TaxID=889453 RepID=A0A1T5F9C9_9BACT|nr:glycoside hydrolase family 43 protein [Alkalitalea saponilacus]ASB50118.1 glycoside hydrolase [Alkalitalea saponilacus]SKB92628.1 Glycosyl hydrolases family 43 [Alkalitalea saponilacus]